MTTTHREEEQALIGLGRAAERAAVVAWLQTIGLAGLADRIEDGAHLEPGDQDT